MFQAPTCDTHTKIGKTCSKWAAMDTSMQHFRGLPSTVPPVLPAQDCWVESQNQCVTPSNVPVSQTCDTSTPVGGQTCNKWSLLNTSYQHAKGLPYNVPAVFPDQDCWDSSHTQCVTLNNYP